MPSPGDEQMGWQQTAGGSSKLPGWCWLAFTVGAIGFLSTPVVFKMVSQTTGNVVLYTSCAIYIVLGLFMRLQRIRIPRRGWARWLLPVTVLGLLLVALLSARGAFPQAIGTVVVTALVMIALIIQVRRRSPLEPSR